MLMILGSLTPVSLYVKAQDSTKKDLLVNIGYYNVNNNVAYLGIHARTKTDGKFKPVGGAKVRLYLDKDSAAYLTGDLITDAKGEAYTTLSPSLKDLWNSSATHTFIALSNGDAAFNAARTETPVAKARLQIDTGAGRTISVSVLELKNGSWTPAKSVDIKVAVRRMGGDLAVSDKESYTTDSTGKIDAEFTREGLPGDKKGLLTLVAKVEDNDLYGNLQVEKTVPWGSVLNSENSFNNRSLWAARFKSPIWLLFMAYFIFISVWSVLIYLIYQFRKIKKAGRTV